MENELREIITNLQATLANFPDVGDARGLMTSAEEVGASMAALGKFQETIFDQLAYIVKIVRQHGDPPVHVGVVPEPEYAIIVHPWG
jgi:hypothetical protein